MSHPPKRTTSKVQWVLGLILVVVTTVAAFAFVWAQDRKPRKIEQFMHLHGLAIAPWAPDDVYISTHQGLIRIGPEGDWSFVSEVPHDFMGFQLNPTEEGVLYSSGHPAPGTNLPNPIGFMVSRDWGVTWRIQALAGKVDFHAMAVQPTNGDVVYGYSGGLFRSLDGGATWERIDADLAQLGNIFALAVHPDDADTVLVGTQTGLWRSTDAGISWEAVVPQVPVTAVAFSGDQLFAYAVSPQAGLVSSRDEGESWSGHGFFLEGNDAVGYIAPHPEQSGTLYLGTFGQNLFKTIDFGGSWEQLAVGGVPHTPDDNASEHEH